MMTDNELLACYLKTHDEEAFGELVHRHAAWVRGVAVRRVHDRHLAEDVTQAVFIVLLQKASALRRKAKRWAGFSFLSGGGIIPTGDEAVS